LNLRANQGDVNYRPDINAGLNSRGYIIQQTENYIALTDKGNTFRNY
jgi:predicted transcriptional regulator